jgi:hypothetical protein
MPSHIKRLIPPSLFLVAFLALAFRSVISSEVGVELPKDRLTHLTSIWDSDRVSIVSGHCEISRFSFQDEHPSLPLEKLHALLKLDDDPSFENFVAGQKLTELPDGIVGPGGWGQKIELDFELEKIRNIITDATEPGASAPTVVTFDGKNQVEFNPLNGQATIFSPTGRLVMMDLTNIRYLSPPKLDMSQAKAYAEEGRAGIVVKTTDIEIHAEEGDGRIHRIVRRDAGGRVIEEILQFGPWSTSAGFPVPRSQVRISCDDHNVRMFEIVRVGICRLNSEIPDGIFKAKTDATSKRSRVVVVDNRAGSSVVKTHEGPIDDVIDFVDNSKAEITAKDRPSGSTTFLKLNAFLGVMLLVIGGFLYWKSKRQPLLTQ